MENGYAPGPRSAAAASCWQHGVMRNLMANGEVIVVETEKGRYLGTVEVSDGRFIVRSGYVGRPVVLSAAEVISVNAPDIQD